MAKFLTNYGANAVIDWIRGVTPPPVSGLTLALYTTAPTVSTAGTQVTGGSYAPQTVTLSAASGGASSNTAVVTFVNLPTCTVVAAALRDSVANETLWVQDGLSISVTSGDNKAVLVGDLDVAFIAA